MALPPYLMTMLIARVYALMQQSANVASGTFAASSRSSASPRTSVGQRRSEHRPARRCVAPVRDVGMQQLTFGTDGWRDVIADRFTFANVRRAAQAYASHLLAAGQHGELVLVGYDTRFLAAEFAATVAAVLSANGLRAAVSQTYLPTPALSFAVARHGAVGGVMLTASHNPARYGGFKIKGPYGGSATDAVYRAVAALVPDQEVPAPAPAASEAFDNREEYFVAIV